MSPEGVVKIPPQVLDAMRLDASREVHVQVAEGEPRLASIPVALERARRLFRSFDKGAGSVVDEFIAERRTEAAHHARPGCRWATGPASRSRPRWNSPRSPPTAPRGALGLPVAVELVR